MEGYIIRGLWLWGKRGGGGRTVGETGVQAHEPRGRLPEPKGGQDDLAHAALAGGVATCARDSRPGGDSVGGGGGVNPIPPPQDPGETPLVVAVWTPPPPYIKGKGGKGCGKNRGGWGARTGRISDGALEVSSG